MFSLFLPVAVAVVAATFGYELGRRRGFEEGRWEDITPDEFAALVHDDESRAR